MQVAHGFYRVKNQIYRDKVAAIIASTQQHDFPHWDFHESAFSAYDWSQEPPHDLDWYYKKRAEQLREKYDYLVLHFSGGTDSVNILQTFIRANIPVDELYIWGAWDTYIKDPSVRTAANEFAVMDFSAYPNAVWYRDNHNPNCKISVVDIRDHVLNRAKQKNWFESGSVLGGNFNPATDSKDWDLYSPWLRKLSDQGKTVGHIRGLDKPSMVEKDGQWWAYFLDKQPMTQLSPRCFEDSGLHVEFFYWQPDLPELIIKQCHVLKKFANTSGLPRTTWASRSRRVENLIASVLYRNTLSIWDCEKAAEVRGVRPFDQWFHDDPHADHMKSWQQTLTLLDPIIPAHWKDDGVSVANGIKGIYSKHYCLGA